MAGYKVISSDSHIFEPPDLWTSRMEREWGERSPRVVRMEDGDWWYADGRRAVGLSFAVNAGVRFEEPEKLLATSTYDNVRPGGHIPEEHVKDMDADGVDAGVLFPSVGFKLYNAVQDSDLLTASVRVYNDWVADFSSAYPKRLRPVAMINADNVRDGVEELERCAKIGLVGAMIPVYPHDRSLGRRYNSPEFERLWATAEDLEMPLHLHILSNRVPSLDDPHSPVAEAGGDDTLAYLANHDYWPRMSLGDIIFSGVFDRYPKLHVGVVEFELSWIPYFIDRLDYTYTQRIQGSGAYRFKDDMLPSEHFHRNVFVGFQEDELGIKLRDIIGVNNILWGSDYPHPESTFPRSRQILEEILRDCTEDEKAKIAGENAARIYHLD